ncbi:kelch domain-containing protein 2-like isoform X2 [Zootermopsis nevadensis]|uniref:kelch domain-containing protein 2-like isoform X2 n=1 Tax=Zootermopsis nevadensis TaxID=136037 RepID=UPI000B8E7125|nr:kelch domain-containing protein 2-like isoform X2 [Zootermopsis nevadensis]
MAQDFISMNERINRRSGHIAVVYGDWMIVWGGYVDHEQQTSTSQIHTHYHHTDELWIYNCLTEVWERILTKGDIPHRNSGSCGLLHEDFLYIFGGFHGMDNAGSVNGNSNYLFRLDLTTMTWEWLHPTGNQPAPCDKLAGWVYDDKLYFFGGFGPQPEFGVPFQHVIDPSTEPSGWPRGWNNQLVVYNPVNNSWEWPKVQGPTPSPRAAHAADISGHKVYVFGGRIGNTRNNDLHCLDMDSMMWSGNLTHPFELNPEGRSWHSLTFITDTRAIVYGGLNQYNIVLNDCWLLTLHSEGMDHEWQEFELSYDHGEPRCSHTACLFPATGELLIHSGSTQPFYETRLKLKVNTLCMC